MISPFEVYLVMQLSSIGSFFFIAGVISSAALGCGALFHSMNRTEYDKKYDASGYENAGIFLKKVPFRALLPASLFFISALIPTTKTAAAMIILPALTSKEVTEPLAKEGKELYALAKQALRDAVDAKPEPSEDKK